MRRLLGKDLNFLLPDSRATFGILHAFPSFSAIKSLSLIWEFHTHMVVSWSWYYCPSIGHKFMMFMACYDSWLFVSYFVNRESFGTANPKLQKGRVSRGQSQPGGIWGISLVVAAAVMMKGRKGGSRCHDAYDFNSYGDIVFYF